MPTIRAMRLLNAIELGSTTGAQLEALLTADPGRLAEFNVLLGRRGQARRLCASNTALVAVLESPTATTRLFTNPVAHAAAGEATSVLATAVSAANMNAVAASSTAMNAVAASSTAINAVAASSTARTAIGTSGVGYDAIKVSSMAIGKYAAGFAGLDPSMYADMNAVAASSTAMNAVAASSTAMNAVAASSTARLALYESDTALNAVFASSIAMTALRQAATIYSKAANSTIPVGLTTGVSPSNPSNTGKYLLLGVSGGNTITRTVTVQTPRAGTTRSNSVSNSGFLAPDASAGALMCCPVTGPLLFVLNSSGASPTYFSLLRCDV